MFDQRRTYRLLFALLAAPAFALGATGCGEPTDELLNGARPSGPPGEGVLPEALQCSSAPVGRSYVQFDGTLLEASRKNEGANVNRARLKPYGALAGELRRVLGAAPASLAGAGASFDDPPPRWYLEAEHSGVSLNAFFGIAFEGCRAYTASGADFAAAPTAESASAVCSKLMRKAWSRPPSAEEVGACAELGASGLDEEPDARRRWAYVCASVLSSSQFLTF